MEDLLEKYVEMALTGNDFHKRNRHKHSNTNSKENNDDTYAPADCHYALGNTFD